MIPYLQVENLTKTIGDLVLFENISFTIGQGQKVALIAQNGTGKSSLLNVIAGIDGQDSGKYTYTNDIKVGYLKQNPDFTPDNTVMSELFTSSSEVTEAIKVYEKAILDPETYDLNEATAKMDSLNAWDFESRMKQILGQLNIFNLEQKIKELSGGQQKRVALAAALIDEPDFLILDEPTNHLDLEMIEWLERFLTKTNCTLFMVTHDRYFLDRVCNEIIEMDDNQTYSYKGNYTYYLEKREDRIRLQNASVEKAQNLLRTELEWARRMPKARGHKSKYRMENVDKLKKQASQIRHEQEVKLSVKSSRLGNKIIEIDNLCKGYDDLELIKDFTYKFSRFEKVGIVGKNGTGKSTFLNLLTKHIAPDSGTIDIGETIRIGYYRQDGINFNPGDKVIDVVREIAEVVNLGNGDTLSASQFLNHFLFPPETQYNYVEKLSGGEQRRLYLCTVLMQNPNFLILDEPTNDLDIMTLTVLEDYLTNFAGCVMVVSHDRYFMDKIVDHLFVFKGNGEIKDFPGSYTTFRDAQLEEEKQAKQLEAQAKPEKKQRQEKPKERKLSYKEKLEFEQLEKDIAELEEEKSAIEELLNSGTLNPDELTEKSIRHGQIKDDLDEKELRWLELSELA
ncbi:ABC transporter ATP-binding protein [Puteibacter caeruleilacunae]|nr:ABC transporter ATP-binding protein [Puteibacter caeruleilacunae]